MKICASKIMIITTSTSTGLIQIGENQE